MARTTTSPALRPTRLCLARPRGRRRGRGWRGGGCRSGAGVARPAETASRLVAALRGGREQRVLEIVAGVLVQLTLPLERARGQAATPLEQGNRLVETLLTGHR